MSIRLTIFSTVVGLSMSACAPGPYLDASRLKDDLSAKTSTTVYPVQPITADVIMAQRHQPSPQPIGLAATETDLRHYDYRVQPQDVLGVTVWDHPELVSGAAMAPTGPAGEAATGLPPVPAATPMGPNQIDPNGLRVASNGTIFFPTLSRLRVEGKTVEQISSLIVSRLAKTIHRPQVLVRMIGFRSQQVQVTGQLKNPGSVPITDVPLRLIDAIARAGGATNDADLHNVSLTRSGQHYQLDAEAVLTSGDMRQNVLLRAGDIVNVPDRSESRVFVIGEVQKPAAVVMARNGLTLADALTSVNSIDPKSADPRAIYVIRGAKEKPTLPKVFRLDMTQVDSLLLQTQFQLQPLDVVYVGTADAARFNRVLETITPTITTVFYTRAAVRGY